MFGRYVDAYRAAGMGPHRIQGGNMARYDVCYVRDARRALHTSLCMVLTVAHVTHRHASLRTLHIVTHRGTS